MGGYSSGRSGWRPVVENVLKLDSYKFPKNGYSYGSFEWTNTSTGEQVASIGYSMDCNKITIKLNYIKTFDGEKQPVNDTILLTKQKTGFHGCQYLFLCPKCSTRAVKLYLPNGALYFRCRKCYNMTYQSSNDSGKYSSLFRSIAADTGVPFEDVKKILKKKW